MNTTILSIVVPVYNVERYLRQCLDSAIVPGVSGYELVCVNDGSTDSSPEILSEYQANYPNLIRVIHTPNGGLGAASNNGIKAAAGDYIAFLDSDDYLVPGAVKQMIEKDEYPKIAYDCYLKLSEQSIFKSRRFDR